MNINFGKLTIVIGCIYIIATLFYIVVNYVATYNLFGQRLFLEIFHNVNIWNLLLFILALLPGVILILAGKKLMKVD